MVFKEFLHKKEMGGLVLTTQTLLQKKVFGNFLPETRPVEYRRTEWQELNQGRERTVRLIVRALLGVPSAHLGEQEHAMWCFQFPLGSLLVAHLYKGNLMELSSRPDDEKEVEEAVDFLINEVTEKLRQV